MWCETTLYTSCIVVFFIKKNIMAHKKKVNSTWKVTCSNIKIFFFCLRSIDEVYVCKECPRFPWKKNFMMKIHSRKIIILYVCINAPFAHNVVHYFCLHCCSSFSFTFFTSRRTVDDEEELSEKNSEKEEEKKIK